MGGQAVNFPDLLNDVRQYCEAEDTDIFIYLGNIRRSYDDDIINLCRKREHRKKNVILMLTTNGGDPNAAYRIGRCLQMVYSPPRAEAVLKKPGDEGGGIYTVLVNGVCKSAGTLIALSADRLLMTGNAELGPLDIQLRKPDEVGERTSGLTPIQAIQFLEHQSLGLFKRHFKQLRFDADLNFPTKLSATIATNITKGLLSPIYEQIDPMRLAEVNRSLSITQEYADRLARNLKDDALSKLIMEYPSHGFVIDREEAKTLFKRVDKPPPLLFAVAESFKDLAHNMLERDDVFTLFLNDLQGPDRGSQDDQTNNNGPPHGLHGENQPETESHDGTGPSADPNDAASSPAAE